MSFGSSPGTSATTNSSFSFSKMSTLGVSSRAGRVFSWTTLAMLFCSDFLLNVWMRSSGRDVDGDFFGLSLGHLGQGQRQHALLQRGFDLFRVDARRQLVALREREARTFTAVRRVTLWRFGFALCLQAEHICGDVDLHVLLAQPRQFRAHFQG